MKFFHLSDLHIGLQLQGIDLMADQRHILGQIVRHAKEERPDAVVIAGDIYNKAAPAPEAVALYDWFMDELTSAVPEAAIMVIAGNHDEALRIDMYGDLLEKQNIYLVGTPPQKPGERIRKAVLHDEHGAVYFWLLPFLTPARVHDAIVGAVAGDAEGGEGAEGAGERGCAAVDAADGGARIEAAGQAKAFRLTYDDAVRALIAQEHIDMTARNVIATHQFYVPVGTDPDDMEHMDSENLRVGGLGAVRADVLAPFDYAALGHLHKPMCLGSEYVRYCGTPMQYSVSEAGQEKGIVVVDMAEKGHRATRVIPLQPLHRIRKIEGAFEDVLAQASDDYAAITVEDAEAVPTLEMRDRIKAAFPNLLSYSRLSSAPDIADIAESEQVDSSAPMDLCLRFLGDATEEQEQMLREVIEEAAGACYEAD